jgi:hypothetical protein
VLGVSANSLHSYAAALAEVTLVQKHSSSADFELEHVQGGLWWWRMSVDDVELARAARGFARRVDAVLSGRRFSQRAPRADIDGTLVVFHPGRRGREITLNLDSADEADEEPLYERGVPLAEG